MKKKISIVTLGCQMNVADSEWVSGLLADDYDYTDQTAEADVLVVNTCAVRDKAEQKFFSLMGRLAPLKEKNKNMALCVSGCIAQESADDIVRRAPMVDIVFGTRAIERFPQLLKTWQETGQTQIDTGDSSTYDEFPMRRASRVTAWVSIMRGCDNRCAYCIVPMTRGPEQSRPEETVVREVADLAARGYREVWLLGQNVNSYGKGANPPTDFARLLRRIDAETGIPWIRFVTSHPKDLSDRLIDALAEIDALCPTLHLPIQSGSDAVLDRMARGYTAARYFDRVERLRERVPDLSLTADVIVGYPGETEADHQATVAAIRRADYDNIYLFKYSPRPGTPAENLPDRVAAEVATRRFDEVNRLQKEITRRRLTRFVGREMTLLVDGPSKRDENRYGGRTPHNITVNFGADDDYTGRFVRVTITGSRQYSLDADNVLPIGGEAGKEKRG